MLCAHVITTCFTSHGFHMRIFMGHKHTEMNHVLHVTTCFCGFFVGRRLELETRSITIGYRVKKADHLFIALNMQHFSLGDIMKYLTKHNKICTKYSLMCVSGKRHIEVFQKTLQISVVWAFFKVSDNDQKMSFALSVLPKYEEEHSYTSGRLSVLKSTKRKQILSLHP